jgi:hypothetical protein
MTLDIHLSRSPDDIVVSPEDEAVFKELELHLSEWIGTGSFGGRRYIELVDRVAGVMLGYTAPQNLQRDRRLTGILLVESLRQTLDVAAAQQRLDSPSEQTHEPAPVVGRRR